LPIDVEVTVDHALGIVMSHYEGSGPLAHRPAPGAVSQQSQHRACE
jgi:hypothetical protein